MREYIEIGPCPCNEPAADIRDPEFARLNRDECQRFIQLIREVCGDEPEGARLGIRSNYHDFGTYREVVCYYDDDNEQAAEYAYHCEGDAPSNWDGSGGKRFGEAPQSVLAEYMN